MGLRRFLLRLGLASLAAVFGRAAEREFERTFPVEPGCTVKLDTYRGSIEIVEGDRPEVHVTVHMEIGSDTEEEAARVYAGLRLEAVQDGNTVTLRARNPRETRVRFVWEDKNQIDQAWRITVPRQCNVDLTTLSGGITIGSLTGHMVARTERGTIYLKRIDGSVDAATEIGDVIVSRCSGDLKARVLRGTIRLGTIGGFVEAKNATGDIEVLAARGGINALVDSGDVYVGFPRDTVGPAQIKSSGGSIYAKIDPAANCVVSAKSFWGHVDSLLPMQVDAGAHGKSKLAGRLGQGGPQLNFYANGGHVKLTPGETYFEDEAPEPKLGPRPEAVRRESSGG